MGNINPTHRATNEHFAPGFVDLDGSNPTVVPIPEFHGEVTGVSLTLQGSSAPGVSESDV